MSVPDNEIISRVLLLAEGFTFGITQELGEKITTWFELAQDCMTSQKHYDWGLRAIKTSLESSGRRLRSSENKDEIKIVINTLRKQIKSKLVDEDDNKFEALIVDVFGDKAIASDVIIQDNLRDSIIKVLEDMQLIIDEVII